MIAARLTDAELSLKVMVQTGVKQVSGLGLEDARHESESVQRPLVAKTLCHSEFQIFTASNFTDFNKSPHLSWRLNLESLIIRADCQGLTCRQRLFSRRKGHQEELRAACKLRQRSASNIQLGGCNCTSTTPLSTHKALIGSDGLWIVNGFHSQPVGGANAFTERIRSGCAWKKELLNGAMEEPDPLTSPDLHPSVTMRQRASWQC